MRETVTSGSPARTERGATENMETIINSSSIVQVVLGEDGWRREADEYCLGLMDMLKGVGEGTCGRIAGCCCLPLLLFLCLP